MSHNVSALFTLPTVLNSLKPAAKVAATASAATAATTSAATTAATTTTTTFLTLLSKELQNQDPTAPVDSTAMVGQMISLNQLDQLIAINQKTAALPATTAAATTPTTPVTPVAGAVGASGAASLYPPAASAAATTQQLFDPNSAMAFDPASGQALINSLSSPTSVNSLNAPLNAATMGFLGSNNTSGGK